MPSAPNSGLNDFFSLKFLKILTRELPSRIAYLEEEEEGEEEGEKGEEEGEKGEEGRRGRKGGGK